MNSYEKTLNSLRVVGKIIMTLVFITPLIWGLSKYFNEVADTWRNPVKSVSYPVFTTNTVVAVKYPSPVTVEIPTLTRGQIGLNSLKELVTSGTQVTIYFTGYSIEYFIPSKSGYMRFHTYNPDVQSAGAGVVRVELVASNNTVKVTMEPSIFMVTVGTIIFGALYTLQ